MGVAYLQGGAAWPHPEGYQSGRLRTLNRLTAAEPLSTGFLAATKESGFLPIGFGWKGQRGLVESLFLLTEYAEPWESYILEPQCSDIRVILQSMLSGGIHATLSMFNMPVHLRSRNRRPWKWSRSGNAFFRTDGRLGLPSLRRRKGYVRAD